MMGWGAHLLSLIASMDGNRIATGRSFFRVYPFFLTTVFPRAHGYLINRLVMMEGIDILKKEHFRGDFEAFVRDLSPKITDSLSSRSEDSYVHLLDLEKDFKDFIRLFARISRMNREHALILKARVDGELEKFRKNLH